jgi:hypothetical protein
MGQYLRCHFPKSFSVAKAANAAMLEVNPPHCENETTPFSPGGRKLATDERPINRE